MGDEAKLLKLVLEFWPKYKPFPEKIAQDGEFRYEFLLYKTKVEPQEKINRN